MLTKRQRNALFNIIKTAGLDPKQCNLTEKTVPTGFVSEIVDKPTGSFLLLAWHDPEKFYSVIPKVGDETLEEDEVYDWKDVEILAHGWAQNVKEFPDIPDLWAQVGSQEEILSDHEYGAIRNVPFTPNEQSRIIEQLQEIKDYLATQHSLSGGQMSQVEARLDELEDASHRLGRKDWLNIFYGVMFTLILTQLVPPDAVQHIIAMVIHGLGDLFGFGGPPPAIPPVS